MFLPANSFYETNNNISDEINDDNIVKQFYKKNVNFSLISILL